MNLSSGRLTHFKVARCTCNLDNLLKLECYTGVDLLSSALHQIGHALGLEHSQDPAAIMFRTVEYKPGVKLSQDDINGIQVQ